MLNLGGNQKCFYMSVLLLVDDIGSSFDPQFACGMDHIRPSGARSCDFPLPECCGLSTDCENEVAPGDCPNHGGPKAACSKPHFLLYRLDPPLLFANGGRRSEPPQNPT
jgi:hypothetical protein